MPMDGNKTKIKKISKMRFDVRTKVTATMVLDVKNEPFCITSFGRFRLFRIMTFHTFMQQNDIITN